ncbi:MAG: substrate-binding domain-containing protein, partial [Planctomycetota bacterium]
LLSRGRRRISWFGRKEAASHGLDRLSGALATLRTAGVKISDRLFVQVAPHEVDAAAREILSRKDGPDGILALWHQYSVAAAGAAAELGKKLGRDLDVVGWSSREALAAANGETPDLPLITWSIRDMAEAVMSRLAERRANPEMPALRVKIPTTLRPSK